MAENYWDEIVRQYKEEQERLNPGSLPADFDARMTDDIQNEFTSRIPDPMAPLPEAAPAPTPDASANLPEPSFEAPPIEPSSFDVHKSADTVTMDGDPRSLPSVHSLPDPEPAPKKLWELEEDPIQEVTPELQPSTPTGPSPAETDRRAAEDAAILADTSDNDKARRESELAALNKRRKLQAIPEFAAGIGDAISASASAFGGNAPGGSMQRLVSRHDKQLAEGKKDIETRLRNDANSDVSKQYQNMLAQMMGKDASDAAVIGLTANQIAEKIPTVEKMMQRRHDMDIKRLALQAKQDKDMGLSPAQKKFDEEMAKMTAEFTDNGGIKVAKAAVKQLDDTITRFKKLDPGIMSRIGSSGPDAARGLYQPEYKAIEQESRQHVTELLRATLGAQFTEREGERIFSQTFDPTLPMKTNLERMEALRDKLNTIADERARAVQYFSQKGTWHGYEPQSSMTWTYDQADPATGIQENKPRTTQSGYTYSVE